MNKETEEKYKGALRKASAQIKELLSRVEALEIKEPIAVIGLGCRFPGGANDPEAFWRLLEEGVDAIREIPPERWPADRYYDPAMGTPGKAYTRMGGFLDQVDRFDSSFFGLTPLEAESLDPQQRLLLEVSWEALERAGLDPDRLKGSRTGVYIGMDSNDYIQAHLCSGDPTRIDAFSLTGVAFSTATGRLSYFYDFRGPSIAIDTACSSSLVALHLAAQSLQGHETDMALAGGVDLILTPEPYIGFSKLQALSPDGCCRAFDEAANGYVKGEGCGLVVLKRLSDARRDGDPVLAVLRATAVNQDGQSGGLTAPNALAQREVILKALSKAGLTPDEIDYIETHGTGTRLGDPIEARALGQVFRSRSEKLLIGSVKTNIGHLQAASGAASLIKVVLALGLGKIPASLHFREPSSHIPWDEVPIEVASRLRDWPQRGRPRIAGVSAFGFSGTNAHVILEEAPPEAEGLRRESVERSLHLLPLSGRSEQALRACVDRFVSCLGSQADASMGDLCHTACVGRTHFGHRLAVVGRDREDFLAALKEAASGNDSAVIAGGAGLEEPGQPNEVVFLFTGQGAQYRGMGRDLYRSQPVFREALERCHGILLHEGLDLLDLLYGDGPDEEILHQTRYTQPVLFAFEYALAELWRNWGLQPAAVLGHSIGEYTAACVAGVFSPEDGLKLAAARGRLIQALPGGGLMAAVLDRPERLEALLQPLGGRVAVAAVNGPRNVVISGEEVAVRQVLGQLSQAGVRSQVLRVSHAFHSPMMEPAIEPFRKVLAGVQLSPPCLPLISNLTGEEAAGPEPANPDYWCRHMRRPVLFEKSVRGLIRRGYRIFLEIGPHAVLTALGRQGSGEAAALWLPSMLRGEDPWRTILSSLGRLYVQGLRIDWPAFDRPYPRKRRVLPSYPFERKRYWKDPVRMPPDGRNPDAANPGGCATGLLQDPAREPETVPAGPAPSGSGLSGAGKAAVIAQLKEMISRISGIERMHIHANVFAMGLSSIMLTQLRQRIQNEWDVEIKMSQFYREIDTIDKLADVIVPGISPVAAPESAGIQAEDALARETPGDSVIERIIGQQLGIMSRQLELLGSHSGAGGKALASTLERLRQGSGPVAFTPAGPAPAPGQLSPARNANVDVRSMKLVQDELSTRQRAFIEAFTARYVERTRTSKALMEQHRPVFSDWINSLGFRLSLKEIIYPIVSHRSQGATLWDVDGNAYIDTAIGYGVNYFGNRAPFVAEAVRRQLEEGYQLGPQFDLTCEVARRISDMTGVERVTFCNTGTEAVMTALRIARTVTGRDKIVLFENSYHGTFDGILAIPTDRGTVPSAPGTPAGMVADVVVLPYGAQESLEHIRAMGRDLAAVLVEPVQSRNPGLQPREFLRELREITGKNRTALIFDEIITGFRLCQGGAQAFFGIQADLVTYGKVLGGGMPIGVVAGKARFMDAIDGGLWSYGDDSYPGKGVTFFGGTFCKHPLTMAATLAVLKHLKEQGPGLQEEVNRRTAAFAERLNRFFEEDDVPLRVRYCASYFRFESCGEHDPALQPLSLDLLFYLLLYKGVYTWERRVCFFSTAHTDADVEAIVSAVKESVAELREGGFPFSRTGGAPASGTQKASFFPLSSEQNRLYILSQLEGGELAYHLPEAMKIEGALDIPRLQAAIGSLAARHESLRTGFEIREGRIVQRVHEAVALHLQVREVEESDLERLVQELIQPFDLSSPPLVRVCLFSLAPTRHLLLFDAHHLIADGLSANIIFQDLCGLYLGQVLPPPAGAHRDHVLWQQAYLESTRCQRDEAFWLARFQDEVPVPDLPADHPRPARQGFAGDNFYLELGEEETRALKGLARETGSSLFTVLLAAHAVLLHRLTGKEDLVVGIPVAGRERRELSEVVGMFVNTLAIRCRLQGDRRFVDFLNELQRDLLDCYDHQSYPFERLVKKLNRPRDMSRNPLFDTIFSFEEVGGRALKIAELTFTPYRLKPRAAMVDLTLEAIESEGRLSLRLEYGTALFARETIERYAGYYLKILREITLRPRVPLAGIEVLSEAEKKRLLFELNDTAAGYPRGKTLTDLFEARVEEVPDRIALVFEGREITYRELNAGANRLAHCLRETHRIQPDDRVALLLDRTPLMIAGILAVIKAGGAYVPINTDWPDDRVAYILKDSGSRLLLTESAFMDRALPPEVPRLDASGITQGPAENPERIHGSGHLAYVIYTSGSTGRPKGCMITHDNVVRLMVNDRMRFDFSSSDVWIMAHAYSFDFSVWEMYGAFLYGGRLILPPFESVRDASRLLELIKRHRVSVLNQTPGAFYNLIQEELKAPEALLDRHLRWVIFGGDRLEPAYLAPWFDRYGPETVRLVNMFGITETTVHVTFYRLGREDVLAGGVSPIGGPIPETTVYLLDPAMNPVPVGSVGEIYVGGTGVCRGYLNRDELTRQRFMDSPFKAGERLYRSGDLGRWLPTGNLVYLGRNDFQVQIKGYRIEPGEVEKRILDHPAVHKAMVIAFKTGEGRQELAVYIVFTREARDAGGVSVHELRRHLRRSLPEYMIPAYWIPLDRLPLTANGKLDQKSLPDPLGTEAAGIKLGTAHKGAETETQEALVTAWEAILGRAPIGVLDNFFDLGGDSIKAIQIVARLSGLGLGLEVRHIFECPTIAELAARLRPAGAVADQGPVTGRVPLTPVQAWFFSGQDDPGLHFTQAVLLEFGGRLDEKALRRALEKIQAHHDALRMRYRLAPDGDIIQEIQGLELPLGFETVDLRGVEESAWECERVASRVATAIDIRRGGALMRACLFEREDRDALLLVIHHLVVDGMSWRILMEDLTTAYGQAFKGEPITLPFKTDSFKRWAESLQAYSGSEALLRERDYWQAVEAIPAVSLPRDVAAGGGRCRDRRTLSLSLSRQETEALESRVNQAYRTEINDILLTALARAMKQWHGASSTVINLEGHGRLLPEDPAFDKGGEGRVDISRTVGWFTSIHPFILTLPDTDDPGEQIRHVRETLGKVPRKGLGYGILRYLQALENRQGLGLSPTPEVGFNYLGRFDASIDHTVFHSAREVVRGTVHPDLKSPHALDLEGRILGGILEVTVTFDRLAFREDTMARLLESYLAELRTLIAHCGSEAGRQRSSPDPAFRGIGPDDIERVLALEAVGKGGLAGVYPLTPMQEGMLFHAVYEQGAEAYFEQFAFPVSGDFEVDRFEACWEELFRRHEALRALFVHQGVDRPLQVVLKEQRAGVFFEDISLLKPEEQEACFEAFKVNDRRRGFDLTRDALTRMSIFKLGRDRFKVIWSFHHILLDGWSAGIVIQELLQLYGAGRRGISPCLPPPVPCSRYLEWIEKTDKETAKAYWSRYLAGYGTPATLPGRQPGGGAEPRHYRLRSLTHELAQDATQALLQWAAASRVTLNTVVQALWGMLLCHYNRADDVVFGAVVSGRPVELPGMEAMVGLFLNTVPVRIRTAGKQRFRDLARSVQADALAGEPYHALSLADIQALSDLKQALFDQVMVFESYPLRQELSRLAEDLQLGFTTGPVEEFEQTSYNFMIEVYPGERLLLELNYNGSAFPEERARGIGEDFGRLLQAVLKDPEVNLEAMREALKTVAERGEQDDFLRSTMTISEDF